MKLMIYSVVILVLLSQALSMPQRILVAEGDSNQVRIVDTAQLASYIDVLNYWAWHHKNITRHKFGSHFVGQKRNKINRFSLIYQYSYQVFENEEQLLNIEIEHVRQF